jgi:hypothetical protein
MNQLGDSRAEASERFEERELGGPRVFLRYLQTLQTQENISGLVDLLLYFWGDFDPSKLDSSIPFVQRSFCLRWFGDHQFCHFPVDGGSALRQDI